MKNKKISIFPIFLSLFFVFTDVFSYQIKNDSVNSSGSEISKSANYKILDTAGQSASGFMKGSNYSVSSGYRQNDGGKISISCGGGVNLSGIEFSGKSDLENNFINCNIRSSDPSGYVFVINSKKSQLTNSKNSEYKIEKISNTTPNFWPNNLTGGTGWGVRLGKESDNYDSGMWGDLDDYGSITSLGAVSGKWVGLSENSNFNLISKKSATQPTGDNQKIYFGFEVDNDTIVPSGEYSTDIYFIALPTF